MKNFDLKTVLRGKPFLTSCGLVGVVKTFNGENLMGYVVNPSGKDFLSQAEWDLEGCGLTFLGEVYVPNPSLDIVKTFIPSRGLDGFKDAQEFGTFPEVSEERIKRLKEIAISTLEKGSRGGKVHVDANTLFDLAGMAQAYLHNNQIISEMNFIKELEGI